MLGEESVTLHVAAATKTIVLHVLDVQVLKASVVQHHKTHALMTQTTDARR
jgi:hypothetical protein